MAAVPSVKVDIAEHFEWARRVCRSFGRHMPWLGEDDAEGIGLLAMTEAAPRWRNDTNASFRTFAYARIRGALLDADRRRCRRQEHKEVLVMGDDFSTSDPLALVSLEASIAAKQVVRRVAAVLDERAAAVVLRHGVDELSQEVAARFGIHPSRVTQIEHQALATAREALGLDSKGRIQA